MNNWLWFDAVGSLGDKEHEDLDSLALQEGLPCRRLLFSGGFFLCLLKFPPCMRVRVRVRVAWCSMIDQKAEAGWC